MQVELGTLHNTRTVVRKPQLEKNFETLQNEVESLGKATSNVTKKNITKLLKDINNNKSSLNGVNLVTGETHYQVLLNNLYSAVEQPHIGADNNNLLEMIKKDLDTSHSNYFVKVKEAEEYYKSNPVGKSVISNKTTPKITVFGKELELKPTVTDGNCGPDSLLKSLTFVQLSDIPSNVQDMRVEVSNTCGKTKEFLEQADVVFGQINKNKLEQDSLNKLFSNLQGCFKSFNEFKSAVQSTTTITWKDNLNNINSWEDFAIYVNNLGDADKKTTLSNIQGLFSISFDSTKLSSVLSGTGRNGITAENYVSELSDNNKKIYLDLQEMKTNLVFRGFVESGREGCPQGTSFNFVNNRGQNLYYLLHGYNQQMNVDVNSHWQYLVPAQS